MRSSQRRGGKKSCNLFPTQGPLVQLHSSEQSRYVQVTPTTYICSFQRAEEIKEENYVFCVLHILKTRAPAHSVQITHNLNFKINELQAHASAGSDIFHQLILVYCIFILYFLAVRMHHPHFIGFTKVLKIIFPGSATSSSSLYWIQQGSQYSMTSKQQGEAKADISLHLSRTQAFVCHGHRLLLIADPSLCLYQRSQSRHKLMLVKVEYHFIAKFYSQQEVWLHPQDRRGRNPNTCHFIHITFQQITTKERQVQDPKKRTQNCMHI